MSLKNKTLRGLFWSFADSSANQVVQFIVGIILARILSPYEFGLIGMLTIFIALSQTFIDSGFTSALIRKKNCTQDDYSTVFYYNGIISIALYLLLVLFSNKISSFFNEPQLKPLIQVLGSALILSSMTIIQRTILTKELNFKLQMRVSVLASLLSGIIAITMAYQGFGVWSLVALTLSRFGLTSVFLWYWSRWKPSLVFNMSSFRELFSFGSKLLISGIINTTYQNVYYLIIGKYYSAIDLGYYTKADQIKALPSQNLNSIISRVSYPVMSTIQDNSEQLKSAYKKIIKNTMYVTFILMLGLAAVSDPLILTLIGKIWEPSVIYLQLLCFVGIFYPLHSLNLNMLQVKGRSDLFLKLEIIKKVLAIPVIVIGIFVGIKAMIIGMIVNTVLAYYLNSYWSGKLIGYSIREQIMDILPSFVMAAVISVTVYFAGLFINTIPIIVLILQLVIGMVLVIASGEITRMENYIYIKEIIFNTVLLKIRDKRDRYRS